MRLHRRRNDRASLYARRFLIYGGRDMKDYEKPWMEIVEIGYIDTIQDSCMDDYECDVEGPGFCVLGD